jgi:hypothetical protein
MRLSVRNNLECGLQLGRHNAKKTSILHCKKLTSKNLQTQQNELLPFSRIQKPLILQLRLILDHQYTQNELNKITLRAQKFEEGYNQARAKGVDSVIKWYDSA